MKGFVAYLLFFISLVYLGFRPMQSEFVKILGAYSFAFGSYLYLYSKKFEFRFRDLFLLGLIGRVVLLFSFPNLSDDIYRFIWDGKLNHFGVNPYQYLPTQVPNLFEGQADLLSQLNSPNYYSIYPPISQLAFYLASFTDSLVASSLILKSILLVSELLSFLFILKILDVLDLNKNCSFIYWLNPLIIIELIGNLHFEALMICFLLGAFYLIFSKKYGQSAILFSLAISTKLLPLMFLPFIWKRLWLRKNFWIFFITLFIFTILLFSPVFYFQDLANFGESLNFYFQKFEFNASIYYLLRELGIRLTGYNQIWILGPLLSVVSASLIFYMAVRCNRDLRSILHFCLLAFTLYLLNTTTVHPWYLSMLIMLNCFFNYKYIIAWSLMIVVSYATYSHPGFQQNLYLIAFEYLVVLLGFIYFDRKKMSDNVIISTSNSNS